MATAWLARASKSTPLCRIHRCTTHATVNAGSCTVVHKSNTLVRCRSTARYELATTTTLTVVPALEAAAAAAARLPRRRYFSGVTTSGDDAGEEKQAGCPPGEKFLVTGSLLDARKAGADSPLRGQFLAVSHCFGPESVAAFAAHAGDDNPIHLDEEYAKRQGPRNYGGCIVHGLMVAGLFSTAFGRAIPGALYVSQSLRFERPVRVGERVDARVEVEQARVTSSGREVLVRCSTTASLRDGTVAVSGQAKVLLPRSCEVRSW